MQVLSCLNKDERGVSAVIVAISLIAIFGATVLSIDAGQLWAAKRNMVTATDASALAQAGAFAKTPISGLTGCTGVWSAVLNANASDVNGTECSTQNVSNDGTSGVVIVQGYKRSPARFSGVLGIGDSNAFSMSASQWGYVPGPTGLRPIALCTYDSEVQDGLLLHDTTVESHVPTLFPSNYWAPDSSTDYAQSRNAGPPAATVGLVHHTVFTSTCQGAPGNFGWIDLNEYGDLHTPPVDCGGNCENQNSGDLGQWVRGGYYGNNMNLSTSDCDASATGTNGCSGDTGAKNAQEIKSGMDYIVNPSDPGNCTMGPGGNCHPLSVPIIVYDTGGGTGSNADFHVVGVAFIRIWNFNLSGSNRYLDIEFSDGLFQGECCSRIPPTNGTDAPPPRGDKICGVDHDPQDPNTVAARCTFSS